MKRSDVINQIIKKYNYDNPNYLEVGVYTGSTFCEIMTNNKDGVDPEHYCKSNYVNYKMTSDEFFEKHVNKKYDIIFIDGLHTAYQVTVDLYNSIKNLNNGGFIVLDDVYPHSEEEQKSLNIRFGVPQTGDVWKGVYHIIDHLTEICEDIYFIKNTERGNLVLQIKDTTNNISIDKTIPTTNFDGRHPSEWDKYDYKTDFFNYMQKMSTFKQSII
jgi:hypothetical protein